MPSAQQKFWKLVIDSRLLALNECQRLHGQFSQSSKASPEDSAALARWLIGEGVLTRYQARVLLAGKPGPFCVGDYTIMDRAGDGQIKGIYEAVSRTSGERAVLLVVPSSAATDAARLNALARKIQKATAGGGRAKSAIEWERQGSLTFAVLTELSPAPVPAQAPPLPAAQPPEEAGPTGPEWSPDLPVAELRRRKRGRNWGPILISWGVALALIGGAGWVWLKLNESVETAAVISKPEDQATTAGLVESGGTAGQPAGSQPEGPVDADLIVGRPATPLQVDMVDDDGQTLWAAPTSGPPLKLEFLPPDAEAILVLRPAELAGNGQGAKMIAAIGQAATAAEAQIRTITGCSWSDIEQLQIGIYPDNTQGVSTAFVVRLAESLTTDAWQERFANQTPGEHAGKTYFESAGRTYYLPELEAGRLVVIGSKAEIETVIDSKNPHLTKEMERLLADTDTQRHFTLVAEPSWVFGAGRAIFVGELARLEEPLREFLGAGIQAVLASGYLHDDLFLELRAYAETDKDPRRLAAHYRDELAALPKRFEAYLELLEPAPYGKAILTRFPKMLDALQQQTRSGAEHHQAVLRAYLPAVAGQNLLLGSELALWEQPKAGSDKPAKPADIPTALAKKISLSFARDTLENSIARLSTEIGVEVTILGSDLQLEGITKNQSFGLDERDQPAGEILLKILKLANSDGKLIYVIKPPPSGGAPIIFITTRAAAAKRGDKVPPELEKK